MKQPEIEQALREVDATIATAQAERVRLLKHLAVELDMTPAKATRWWEEQPAPAAAEAPPDPAPGPEKKP